MHILRCISFLSAFAVSLAAQPATPLYRAARTLDAIRIDGQLHEFTWAALPRAGRFRDIRHPHKPGSSPTDAVIAWDDTNLYVAFICIDREPWGTMMTRDSFLWQQEVVEVFLDPDGDGREYAELEVSPHNVVVDLLIPGPPTAGADAAIAARWNIEGLQTAVGKHAQGWTVEIAIPWKALGAAGVSRAPREGDRWRVGLYRIERPGAIPRWKEHVELQRRAAGASGSEKAVLDQQLAELEQNSELLAWSPTRKSFHDPERFGTLVFVLEP